MVTDQQIVDAIDRQGAGENTDPHSIAEHFCDLEVANGEYDGCSTDLELAFHEYETRARNIIRQWHKYDNDGPQGLKDLLP